MSDLFTDHHYAAWDDDDPVSEQWTVHVSGPDDVLPAKDYADAVKLANEINAYYEKEQLPAIAASDIDAQYFPRTWATPCLKGRYAYPLTRDELR